MSSLWLRAAAIGLGIGLAQPALANVHFIEIVEVFPGTTADPTIQYVLLQMHSGGQNFTSGSEVQVFDNANQLIQAFSFNANVASGANQSRILIATQSAADAFGITADLAMQNVIPLVGGKICFFSPNFSFNEIDCVAWGNHPGSAAGGGEANVGTPFNAATGLVLDQAMTRRLDIDPNEDPLLLDGSDDTNDSASDFVLSSSPQPINNAGDRGIPLTCGDGVLDAGEQCDGVNLNGQDCTDFGGADPNGLVCNVNCTINTSGCAGAVCGNGIEEGNEKCDDGNVIAGDGCDAACQKERNGICSVNPVPNSPLNFSLLFGAFVGILFVVLRRRSS